MVVMKVVNYLPQEMALMKLLEDHNLPIQQLLQLVLI